MLPHQKLSVQNNYEQKINYDWPKHYSNIFITKLAFSQREQVLQQRCFFINLLRFAPMRAHTERLLCNYY